MAREAINRRFALVVTVHAEAHVQVDVPLRDRPFTNRTVAGGASDLRANVRRVIELYVRLRRVVEDAVPHEILTALLHRRNLFDPRPVRRNGVVADHARADAWEPRHRAGGNGFVAILRAADLLANVSVVGKLHWLLRFVRVPPDEVVQRLGEAGSGRGEHTGALPWQNRDARCGRLGTGVEHPAAEAAGQDEGADDESAPHSPIS